VNAVTSPPDNPPRLLTRGRRIEIGRMVAVAIVIALFWRGLVPFAVLVGAIALGLYPLARTGLRDLWDEHKVGTELFVTIATLIALIGGEPVAGAVLMTIILIAEFVADLNTDRARASIQALVGAAPRTAILRTPTGEQVVPVADLKLGAVVLTRAGDQIPVDGNVVSGTASVNEAVITGESLPVDKQTGSVVLAGTMIASGALDITVERVGPDTTFGRIITLVEHADADRAPVQKLADRVAAWLLPVVLVFLIAVFIVTHDIRKIVALMIFTSPAELGLATPMVMISAIARGAREGILIKGGLYLEQLAKVDVMVFDKTGTLTSGQPAVERIDVHQRGVSPGGSEDEVLRYAAAADRRSGHPLAQAVVRAAEARGLVLPEVESFETVHGRGVIAVVEAREVIVGNAALLDDRAVKMGAIVSADATLVHVAVNGLLIGTLHLADQIRPEAAEAVRRLTATGIKRTILLTGDTAESATRVAALVGITDVRAGLLPEQKLQAIDQIKAEGHVVAMVGDGVNDAPALARADVGIAMGARGSQAALDAADIALMTDDLNRIVTARTLAHRAYRTIQENLIGGVALSMCLESLQP
jgi:heavy metal translocating P-type ATPase